MNCHKIPINIALVDDHVLIRDALATVINGFENCIVTATATNGKEFTQALNDSNLPEIVILDLNMPEMDGCETARWLTNQYPSISIIVLRMFNTETVLLRLLKLGVKAFLKKDT